MSDRFLGAPVVGWVGTGRDLRGKHRGCPAL